MRPLSSTHFWVPSCSFQHSHTEVFKFEGVCVDNWLLSWAHQRVWQSSFHPISPLFWQVCNLHCTQVRQRWLCEWWMFSCSQAATTAVFLQLLMLCCSKDPCTIAYDQKLMWQHLESTVLVLLMSLQSVVLMCLQYWRRQVNDYGRFITCISWTTFFLPQICSGMGTVWKCHYDHCECGLVKTAI